MAHISGFRASLLMSILGLSVQAATWDRQRRCDQDFEPPCGVCEGVGGLPTSDTVIALAGCQPLVNDSDPAWPVWPRVFETPYFEILIGPRRDPFCFVVTATNDTYVNEHFCYRQQWGMQYYQADSRLGPAFRYDIEYKILGAPLRSDIVHVGSYMTIQTSFATWPKLCTTMTVQPRAGGHGTPVGPLLPNWTQILSYVGTELLQIEAGVGGLRVNHFVWGPHHVWAEPLSGRIVRMWQPFNGLEVFPHFLELRQNGSFESDFFMPPHCNRKQADVVTLMV